MIEIQLILSEDCNLACKYCYCAVSPDQKFTGKMSNEVARQAVDLLLSQETQQRSTITFFGGEPLLNQETMNDCLEYSLKQGKLRNRQVGYSITTNATLLNEDSMDKIVKYNFGLLVSVDGPQSVHDAQCPQKNGSGSFELATKKIKQLMARRSVGVRATLAHPLPNISEVVDFFKEFGFHAAILGMACNREGHKSDVDLTPEEIVDFADQYTAFIPEIIEDLLAGKEPYFFPGRSFYYALKEGTLPPSLYGMACGAGFRVVAVDQNGKLYPCAKFAGMENWGIGSVTEGLDTEKCIDIWYRYQQAIQPHCGKCWAWGYCHGPCIWQCACNDGSIKFSGVFCEVVKKSLEEAIYIFSSVKSQEKNSKNSITAHQKEA